MKLSKVLFLCFVSVVICSCVTPRPQLTREQWLALTSRSFFGLTKDQVIGAAERVFRLADGDDFTIVHMEDGIYAVRKWSFYFILTAGFGADYWLVKVTPTPYGAKATVQVSTEAGSITPIGTTSGAWTATTVPMAGQPINGSAIYDVFWARMFYLLGKRPDWMTCEMANSRVSQGAAWGDNSALCNSLNMKDETPSAPIIPYKGTQ